MRRPLRTTASIARRSLLLLALGSLLATGLAAILPRAGSASPGQARWMNAKHGPLAPETHEQELTPAPQARDYVIESDGERTRCRVATQEETQSLQPPAPDDSLNVITHEESLERSRSEPLVQAGTGLKIILRGTPQLEQFPAAKAAFIRAAQRWESLIQTPITLVIDVDYGPTRFGTPYPDPDLLGSTSYQPVGGSAIYPVVRAALIARASSSQELALDNALPVSQVPTDLGSTAGMIAPAALFRALGILTPVADPDNERLTLGPPPAIGFNSAQPFDFDPSDGIAPGKYDFDATATHEIGHALGFFSEVGEKERAPSLALAVSIQDLFRFRPGIATATFSSAPRILSPGGVQLLFGGGPTLSLSTGRNDNVGGDGQQACHWKDDVLNGGTYIGIMDPTEPQGRRQEITANDLTALDLMGYQVNAIPADGESVPIASGAPQSFAIPAPAPNGALLGSPQYRIQVPSGASLLKVDLSGDQDVDLYVRFGRPIEIQNNMPVVDFRSDSPTGIESISILPSSAPALQAGTYYIAIGNFGPGEARGTLAATVTGGSPTPTPTPTPTPPAGARIVRIGPGSGAPGGSLSVPVELVSQGDENALGFSLVFDPTVLGNPQATLGSDAGGATLNLNTGQVGSGRLGLALSLPFGQKFSAGTRQIVTATFAVAAGTSASSTQIGFGDQPIPREISDVNARALQASYAPGTVAVATGLEGDVAPRPNGNGAVSVTDWVQIGRFVAGLDAPSSGEFQRADCAPRETRGNGSLTIADWVQAGRYAAGLDAPSAAGGPANPAGFRSSGPVRPKRTDRMDEAAGTRGVRLRGGYVERGQQSTVLIELEAQGNENAVGFSLDFDPAQLGFVSAAAGADASSAAINVNAGQAAKGRIGIALALPAGQTLPAGRRHILVLNFAVVAESGAATAALSFGDQPVARELSDINAAPLPANFANGTVLLTRSATIGPAASYMRQWMDLALKIDGRESNRVQIVIQ